MLYSCTHKAPVGIKGLKRLAQQEVNDHRRRTQWNFNAKRINILLHLFSTLLPSLPNSVYAISHLQTFTR